jgi:hypothetical protein
MPEDRLGWGVRTKLGVAIPVLVSFWNNLFGVAVFLVAEDWGVDEAALVSSLKRRFGEDVRIVTFFEGGVLPGVVGRAGCGVICFDGVAGFLMGVPPVLSLDFGVVE